MEEIPLDQYCAQQTIDGKEDGNILTENPNVVLQGIDKALARKHDSGKGNIEDEPQEKKRKEDVADEVADKKKRENIEDGELIEDGTSTTKQTTSVKQDDEEKDSKKKVALLLSYCGGKYHGMQKNPDVETIELKLFQALLQVKSIREIQMKKYLDENWNQLSFNRAARTDKGVSAVRQVVSMKDDFVNRLNAALPEDIRCFGYERVTKGFDAKNSCSGRNYEYIAPTFAFAPDKNKMDPSYRMCDKQFELLNSLLKCFEGTHNYHNFTSGKHPMDKSAIRYITKCEAKKPFECRQHEFVAIEIAGQSFMIHQIRKMIGMCISICRGYCPKENIDLAWEHSKLDIPRAPGLGLLLNEVFFKKYNEKYGKDGIHKALTWTDCELEVERFKIEHIWQSIIEEEIKKSSMVSWLKSLSCHTYSTLGTVEAQAPDFKGTSGVFPQGKKKKHSGKRPWQYEKKNESEPKV